MSATTTAPAPVEVVLDDTQAAFTGSWTTSSFKAGYYGTGYRTTDRLAASALPRTVRWVPALPAAGQHTVEVWLPDGGADRSSALTYRLHHAGRVTELVVDQTVRGGRWRPLGREPFTFAGTGDEYLELRVADLVPGPGVQHLFVIADAVRFATPPPALTAPPTGVRAATGRNYVELHWDALDGAERYVVGRTAADGSVTEVGEVTGRAFLDLDVDGGVPRGYTVAGLNGAGLGPASARLDAAPVAGPPLQAVQGLVLSDDAGRPRLDWRPQRDATAYVVLRSRRNGGRLTPVARLATTSFTDAAAPEEAHYVVRAVNGHGECVLPSRRVSWHA